MEVKCVVIELRRLVLLVARSWNYCWESSSCSFCQ